jgi:NAD(P)-dependent dehydrogenase (short-subunit alcohol dehydrogenase family)
VGVPARDTRIALVSGANRGIGREVARQLAQRGFTVLAGARDPSSAAPIAHVRYRRLDVTDAATVEALAAEIDRDFGHLDVLVNNAAIHYDTWQRVEDADLGIVGEAWETNVVGPWRLCQAVLPLLRRSPGARIVNVSSEAGSLADMGSGVPAYRVTKAALNALTRVLAAELRGQPILVNAVCPGWVATDMGGAGGRPVAEGAASVLWAVDLPDTGPTGGFFRDGSPVPW